MEYSERILKKASISVEEEPELGLANNFLFNSWNFTPMQLPLPSEKI